MNELLFCLDVFVIVFFLVIAAHFGKEALFSCVVIQTILANLFISKLTQILHLDVTCSDIFSIGCLLSLNIIQKLYGTHIAQKASNFSLIGLLFFLIFSHIHLYYSPSPHDIAHNAFSIVFFSHDRVILSSFVVFFMSQRLDLFLFSYFRKKKSLGALALPNSLSIFLSQLFDTVVFSFLALYGSVPSISAIILFSLTVKLLGIFSSSFVLVSLQKFLPKDPHDALYI